MRFTVRSEQLPGPSACAAFTELNPPAVTREDMCLLVETAQRSVERLGAELNRVVTPVIDTLDRS